MLNLCSKHNLELFLVCKDGVRAMCPMCVVALKPNPEQLVVLTEFVKEKQTELQNLFMRNVEIIQRINQMIDEAKHQNFNQKLIEKVGKALEPSAEIFNFAQVL